MANFVIEDEIIAELKKRAKACNDANEAHGKRYAELHRKALEKSQRIRKNLFNKDKELAELAYKSTIAGMEYNSIAKVVCERVLQQCKD